MPRQRFLELRRQNLSEPLVLDVTDDVSRGMTRGEINSAQRRLERAHNKVERATARLNQAQADYVEAQNALSLVRRTDWLVSSRNGNGPRA